MDFKTGEMVFSVPMEAFEFRKSLMQRHLNENYVESKKYPKATIKGFISDIDGVNLSREHSYLVDIEGELTIHGVTRKIKTKGTLDVKGKKVLGTSKFSVTPQEFNIEIPRIVRNNIAKRIDITVDVLYEPYTGKNL
ncbi:YceI family protein [Pontibacter toksunensis]|uniref:YceI family protein n=1 Tax=Pontibacter toksunensis TaxID=1332631 RepID=A0ABW6BXX7_9BACT